VLSRFGGVVILGSCPEGPVLEPEIQIERGSFLSPPSGAGGILLLPTHGLRRGLHSFAASRLGDAILEGRGIVLRP
jgi:hypothetical protein